MRIDPAAISSIEPASARTPRGAGGNFAATLLAARGPGEGEAVRGEAQEAARQLVSSAFILPLLQQMREDPLRVDLIHGGTAEDLFGQQLDTLIADGMVRKAGFDLVDAVQESIMGR